MIRVVVDTNVLISALLHANSLPEAVINLATSSNVQWIASEAILAEYGEVLRRPRLAFDSAKVADAMTRIRASVSMVVPTVRVDAANDPDDNMFLECAQRETLITLSRATLGTFPKPGRKVAS